MPLPITLLWYKLARFYGLFSSLRIFRFRTIFLWIIDHDSAGYLTELIAGYYTQATIGGSFCGP